MKIDVLYIDGCCHYESALALVREVASDLKLTPRFRVMQVSDLAEAHRRRFFGSPSVQIDGVDIDLAVQDREDFVFG